MASVGLPHKDVAPSLNATGPKKAVDMELFARTTNISRPLADVFVASIFN